MNRPVLVIVLLFTISSTVFSQQGSRTLRVAVYPANEPLVNVSTIAGRDRGSGFLVALVDAIADEIGLTLREVVFPDADSAALGVLAGEADMVLDFDYELMESYRFTPGAEHHSIVWTEVFSNDPGAIQTLEELNGAKIGLLTSGTNQRAFAQFISRFDVAVLRVYYEDFRDILRDVDNGSLDGFLGHNYFHAVAGDQYFHTGISFFPRRQYFAIAKGSGLEAVLAEFDQVLVDWKADGSSLYYDLRTTWLYEPTVDRIVVPVWVWVVLSVVGLTALASGIMVRFLTKQVRAKNIELRDWAETLEHRVDERTNELLRAQDQLVAAEKMLALGTLVRGVSHELNTPLGNALTVLTYLASQLDDIDPESFREGFETLHRSLDRAIALVNDLRTIPTNANPKESIPIALLPFVSDLVNTKREELNARHIDVHVTGDSVELRSYIDGLWPAIINIVNNALIHPYTDGGTIEFEIVARDKGAEIRYRDHGRGMDADMLAHLFEPFYTTDRSNGGAGLGMYLVYTIAVDYLGGTVEASSEPGKGTQITIVIPDLGDE